MKRIYSIALRALPDRLRQKHRRELELTFDEALAASRGISRFFVLLRALADIFEARRMLHRQSRTNLLASTSTTRRRTTMPLESMTHDLTLAARALSKRPGFAVVALVTLSLGIGAVTAVFSVVNGVLVQPLPYAGSDRIVILWHDLGNGAQTLPALRRTELGIRMAIGASPPSIQRDVLVEGLRVVAVSTIVGLAGAGALGRWLSGVLYGVEPVDLLTFAFVAVTVGALALAACWLPARRATRVDPVVVLKSDSSAVSCRASTSSFVLLTGGKFDMLKTLMLLYLAAAPTHDPKVEDIAWLAGHWRGEGLGGDCEEVWSAPMAGTMMGSFRLVKDGEVVFYELMILTPEGMKLKHFTKELVGWEEKADFVTFPLERLEPNRAVFKGLSIERDGDRLDVRVRIKSRSGEVREEPFVFHRYDPDEPPAEGATATSGR